MIQLSLNFVRRASILHRIGYNKQPQKPKHPPPKVMKAIEEGRQSANPNLPINMENPYSKEPLQCVLCRLRITPDYKNIRLLSQFVSRFTGKLYHRHITGLCKKQQDAVEKEITKAHYAGLMPAYFRDPRFAHDPKLVDPENPFRPHKY